MFRLGSSDVFCKISTYKQFVNVSFRRYMCYESNPKKYATKDGVMLILNQYHEILLAAKEIKALFEQDPQNLPFGTIFKRELGHEKSIIVYYGEDCADCSPMIVRIADEKHSIDLTMQQFSGWYDQRDEIAKAIDTNLANVADSPELKRAEILYQHLSALLLYKVVKKGARCWGCENDCKSQLQHDCFSSGYMNEYVTVGKDEVAKLSMRASWIRNVFGLAIEFVEDKVRIENSVEKWEQYYLNSCKGNEEVLGLYAHFVENKSFENCFDLKTGLILNMYECMYESKRV